METALYLIFSKNQNIATKLTNQMSSSGVDVTVITAYSYKKNPMDEFNTYVINVENCEIIDDDRILVAISIDLTAIEVVDADMEGRHRWARGFVVLESCNVSTSTWNSLISYNRYIEKSIKTLGVRRNEELASGRVEFAGIKGFQLGHLEPIVAVFGVSHEQMGPNGNWFGLTNISFEGRVSLSGRQGAENTPLMDHITPNNQSTVPVPPSTTNTSNVSKFRKPTSI